MSVGKSEGKSSGCSAFTILEVCVVAGIIAFLAAVFLAGAPGFFARAESVQCLANMRSIHVALNSYLQDKGSWPQEPIDPTGTRGIDEEWWINELTPYEVSSNTWLCPTIKRATVGQTNSPKMHYSPSMFDSNPRSPFKFSQQPWLIEIAGMHGRGANICFPDGSIRQMDDLVPPSKK